MFHRVLVGRQQTIRYRACRPACHAVHSMVLSAALSFQHAPQWQTLPEKGVLSVACAAGGWTRAALGGVEALANGSE